MISPLTFSKTVFVMVIFVMVPSKKPTLTSSPTTMLLLIMTVKPAAKLLIKPASPKPIAMPRKPKPMIAPITSKAKKTIMRMLPIA